MDNNYLSIIIINKSKNCICFQKMNLENMLPNTWMSGMHLDKYMQVVVPNIHGFT